MKKIYAWILVLLLLLPVSGLGEGKLEVVQQNLYLLDGKVLNSMGQGYYFAKVQNTGDAPIGTGSGTLTLYGENKEILLTEKYVNIIPTRVLLQPGEYAYVEKSLYNSILLEKPVVEYEFVTESYEKPAIMDKVAAEVSFDFPTNGSHANLISVTFTNTTDKPGYNFNIAVALLDKDNNILFVDKTSRETMAVHPGSTITEQFIVNNKLVEYYNAHGLEATMVDAIVGIVDRGW